MWLANCAAISRLLSFTTFLAGLKSAAMPRLVFSVKSAEPFPTNAAMAVGGRITRLACGGQSLTDPFEVRRLFPILLLQHGSLLLCRILSPCHEEVVTKNTKGSRVFVATLLDVPIPVAIWVAGRAMGEFLALH